MNEQWRYIHNMRNRGNAIPTRLVQKLSGSKPTSELTLRQAGSLSGGGYAITRKTSKKNRRTDIIWTLLLNNFSKFLADVCMYVCVCARARIYEVHSAKNEATTEVVF